MSRSDDVYTWFKAQTSPAGVYPGCRYGWLRLEHSGNDKKGPGRGDRDTGSSAEPQEFYRLPGTLGRQYRLCGKLQNIYAGGGSGTSALGTGKPDIGSRSKGRFLAKLSGFLDPEEYPKGRLLSVTGTLSANIRKPIGKYLYDYPVIEAEARYLWPEEEPYYPPTPIIGIHFSTPGILMGTGTLTGGNLSAPVGVRSVR